MKNKKVIVIIAVLAVIGIVGIAFALAGSVEKKETKKININLKKAGFIPRDGEQKKLLFRPELMKPIIKLDPKMLQQLQNNAANKKDKSPDNSNTCNPEPSAPKNGSCAGAK